MASLTFETTFIATVLPEYANFGVSGYTIGTTRFRSLNSLSNGLAVAFSKDLGSYHQLEVKIDVIGVGIQTQALCTADNYNAVVEALQETIEEPRMTLENLLKSE